ncbi:MAG: ParB/RepB/Spo0J family partition protein [Alphaproteobacteria bacterium]|mgnify:FL=1|jgi:ParB family chromosome partitioning protein|nr:ParB/RepB/Spo0J family partition protein [Alphaproteobacteria bacterium]CDB53218.1 chromosome segregation DNA-binding protein [Azospirillum sp. CAG:239]
MLENEKLDDLDILGDAGKPEEHSHGGKRKSLGRGLGALLGDAEFNIDEALNDTPTQPVQAPDDRVDVNLLFPSPFQPRKDFDEEALNALVESVKEKGVLQPLLVRKKNGRFEIIAGERRWRASKLAGLQTVPVIVKDMDDKEVLEVALVENLLRENLSAIEEAEGFQRLIDEFSHTQEALAQIVGKSRSHVANTLRLLNLPDSVKDLVREGTLSAGHARALVGLDNAETLAKQIVAKDLNVRQVEELVAKQKNPEVKEPKKAKDEDIVEIEKDLNKNLGLRIKISPSKQGGGKVVLQYASAAELDMIIDILEQKRKTSVVSAAAPVEAAPVGNEKFTMKIID